jgi:hypothetical protein
VYVEAGNLTSKSMPNFKLIKLVGVTLWIENILALPYQIENILQNAKDCVQMPEPFNNF